MDFNSINNCMSNQQKLSLSAAALQQMIDNGELTYDDINNKMSDQQKLSLIASALQELKDKSSAPLPLYIMPSFADYSDEGDTPTGELYSIQGRGTSFETFTDAMLFGFDPEFYHPLMVTPSVELPNGIYLNANVPAQYGSNANGEPEIVFSIYDSAASKEYVYSLTLSQSEEEARGGGHAIDAIWQRLA